MTIKILSKTFDKCQKYGNLVEQLNILEFYKEIFMYNIKKTMD